MNILYLLYLLCLKGSQNFQSTVVGNSLNIEICNNQLDDDKDGLIDVFDPDCKCSTSLGPINFVPNGQFEETTKCCADLKASNCLENWIVTGPSPDYVSDNCPNADLRPDIRVLSNGFNSDFNEGYIFGLVNQRENRHFTESMGVCLTEPLIVGKTYRLFFDLGNLRNNKPNMLFSILGIGVCSSLNSYNTMGNRSFWELDLPFGEMTLDSSAVYRDTLLNANGCDSIVTLALNVQETAFGDTLEISQMEGTTYTFHGNAYAETGVYDVALPTAAGCDSIVYLSLLIEKTQATNLYIPNAFSPNSDGQNDVFQVAGTLEALEQIESVKIFNRWGVLIFQQEKTSDQLIAGWDGRVNGKLADLGTYIYVIAQARPGDDEELLTGEFLLLR